MYFDISMVKRYYTWELLIDSHAVSFHLMYRYKGRLNPISDMPSSISVTIASTLVFAFTFAFVFSSA